MERFLCIHGHFYQPPRENPWLEMIEVQDSAYRHQREVEAGERVIVGVNKFQEEGEEPLLDILRINPALEREQVERLRALRARRPPAPWRAALDALDERARGGDNLMPALIEAVLAWATVGEIAGCLRSLIGYTDQPTAMQLVVYLAVLAITFVLMRLYGAPAKAVTPAPAE